MDQRGRAVALGESPKRGHPAASSVGAASNWGSTIAPVTFHKQVMFRVGTMAERVRVTEWLL